MCIGEWDLGLQVVESKPGVRGPRWEVAAGSVLLHVRGLRLLFSPRSLRTTLPSSSSANRRLIMSVMFPQSANKKEGQSGAGKEANPGSDLVSLQGLGNGRITGPVGCFLTLEPVRSDPSGALLQMRE